MLRKQFCKRPGAHPVVLVLFLLFQLNFLLAQSTDRTILKGTVTGPSGAVVANVTVAATNVDNGKTQSTTTDAQGAFAFEDLAPGQYHLKFEAAGFKTLEISFGPIHRADTTVLDEKLVSGESVASESIPAQQQNLPNAPISNGSAPSLSDLGLTPEQTQGDPHEQALLDKRTHMLKIHQRMGLITTIPLIATVATSLGAGGKNTSSASRDLHTALGGVAGDLYFITAYYAIRAPRVPGTETRGPIRFHKAMAWIHGPGMILTPILGIMAFDEKNKGEKVHGIASAHAPVAIVTAGAFGAALLSVSIKF